MPRPDRVFLHRLLLVALICNVLLLAWYIGVDYRAYLHSDSAAKNMLAQEIVETGSYFPAQWHYVNGDLWVLFTHTLVLPFLLLVPNGWAAHAGAGMLGAALVLHATWLLARDLGASRSAVLAALVVASAGLSLPMAEHLYGQAAYGLLYCMGVWLLACCVRAARATGRRRAGWIAAAAAVLLLAFWANPQRATASCLAPLLAAAVVVQARKGALPRRHDVAAAALLLAAALGGTLLYAFTCRHLNAAVGMAPTYVTLAGMAANCARMLDGFLLLLAGVPPAGGVVTHARGIVAATGLLAALGLLFVLLPWSVGHAWRRRLATLDAALAFTLAGLAVALFFALTTTLTVTAIDGTAARYVVPHFMMLLVIFTCTAVDATGPARPVTLAAWALLALLAVRAPIIYGPVSAADYRRVHAQQADRMLDFIRAQGLEYGYAPFWDAGRMTLMANHRVRLRPIQMANGLPVPLRHLTSDRWFEPHTWRGRTFLLLNEEEWKKFRPDLLAAYAGPPQATLDFEGWRIVVYDHNIAADLPSWDTAFRTPRHFLANESIGGQAGHVQAAQQAPAIVAGPGEAGALAFGQNLGLARGRYVATFDIEASGTGESFGVADVVSVAGTVTHAAQPIIAGRHRISLAFTIDRPTIAIELRAISNGTGRITLYGITLQSDNERTVPSAAMERE